MRALPLVLAAAAGLLAASFVPVADEGPVPVPAVVAPPPAARVAPPRATRREVAPQAAPDTAVLDDVAATRASRRALADALARDAFEGRLASLEATLPPEILERARAAVDARP